eukprot:Rmarinus@m.17831
MESDEEMNLIEVRTAPGETPRPTFQEYADVSGPMDGTTELPNDGLDPFYEHDDSESRALESVNKEIWEASLRAKFWDVAYYRPYFNVNTDDVKNRCIRALWPLQPMFPKNQTAGYEAPPDLYGPFWIAATLLLMLAATSNIASYIDAQGDEDSTWEPNFTRVSVGAGVIYGFLVGLPILQYILFSVASAPFDLLQAWCLYGYALITYVPLCVVLIVPVEWMRWLIIFAILSSVATLVFRTYRDSLVGAVGAEKGYGLLMVPLVGQFGLALFIKLYFFPS